MDEVNQTVETYSLSSEPLFLVKWRDQSYAHVTWEPIQSLKGVNLEKVKKYLSQKHQINMQDRQLNSRKLDCLALLLAIEDSSSK